MILQALNHYYERLADDQQDIAPYGFSRQKISFCAVVESDGTLNGFEQVVSEVRRGKPIPQGVIVPGQSKPSGAGLTHVFYGTTQHTCSAWSRKVEEATGQRAVLRRFATGICPSKRNSTMPAFAPSVDSWPNGGPRESQITRNW